MASTQNLFQSSASASASAPASDEETCIFAFQLASLLVLPKILKTAIELDIFEIIAKAGPDARLSPAEISAQFPRRHPHTPAMLDRMLGMLASYDVLACSLESTGSDGKVVEKKYGAAPVSKFFSKNGDGMSVAPIALMSNDRAPMEKWYYLKDAIMDGEVAFDKAYGMSAYEFNGKEPRFSMVFNEAMRNHSAITMKGILESYKGFDAVNLLVDVGGGVGATLDAVVKKHPLVKGINFDLSHVVSNAPPISAVEHVAGDMFESVPTGDAILMKSTLHNWSDDRCVKLLKNCWKALPADGKVIVMEYCLPVYPEHTKEAQYVFHMDLIAMVTYPGKERTKKEFESLATEAGFSRIEATFSYAGYWVLEFYK
ncbi:caffeic acid 3-O-methyltransferase-like [Iris pallida]|uniref:Caffeic acid 3-O-methyltransferase-like n=1 Tax=Iris pallida TaxID=29817 RepID=A0AAX6I1X7_IRIPA|nr:caffeic acid 3-O-methyltransferase-like [Iris pallida]